MALISTIQASEELKDMLQVGLADDCGTHVRLATMQSVFHAYYASSQLVSSIKEESANARNIMWVGIINPFWLKGMETQDFP